MGSKHVGSKVADWDQMVVCGDKAAPGRTKLACCYWQGPVQSDQARQRMHPTSCLASAAPATLPRPLLVSPSWSLNSTALPERGGPLPALEQHPCRL